MCFSDRDLHEAGCVHPGRLLVGEAVRGGLRFWGTVSLERRVLQVNLQRLSRAEENEKTKGEAEGEGKTLRISLAQSR